MTSYWTLSSFVVILLLSYVTQKGQATIEPESSTLVTSEPQATMYTVSKHEPQNSAAPHPPVTEPQPTSELPGSATPEVPNSVPEASATSDFGASLPEVSVTPEIAMRGSNNSPAPKGSATPETVGNEPGASGTAETPISESESNRSQTLGSIAPEPGPSADSSVKGEPESTVKTEGSNPEPAAEVTEPHATSELPGSASPEAENSEPEANATSDFRESLPEVNGTAESVTGMSEVGVSPEIGIREPDNSPTPEGSAAIGTAGSEPGASGTPEAATPEAESDRSQAKGSMAPEPGPSAESRVNGEPESAVKTEGSNSEPAAEVRPSPVEIVLPPFTLMIIIMLGLSCLSVKSQYHTLSKHIKRYIMGTHRLGRVLRIQPANTIVKVHMANKSVDNALCLKPKSTQTEDQTDETDSFLSPFDLEVIESIDTFNNRPRELARIAFPALLSLGLCPITLYLYVPLVRLFWPSDTYKVIPNINEAISCFLAPAGLVYATSFGFAFQQALSKQNEVLNKVTFELGLLDQITTLASKLSLPMLKDRMNIYRAVKAETIFMVLQIEDREPHEFENKPQDDVRVKLWSIMDTLRNIGSGQTNSFSLDRIITEKIVDHMLQLNSICSDRMGTLHGRIHPLKWAFLETLGFFSFFGVLLLQANSYRMELAMCIITVFSISLLCYVVSDLDSPFSGFFRVDLTVLPDVVQRVHAMHEFARQGQNNLCSYPDT